MELVTSSVISQFPETPQERDVFVGKLIDEVASGICKDPIMIEIRLSNMESVIRRYRADERVKLRKMAAAEEYLETLYNSGTELPF
jgi:hypothetical protein